MVHHVVQMIGWDESKRAWVIKTSWGPDWGGNGFGWIAGAGRIAIVGGGLQIERNRKRREAEVSSGFGHPCAGTGLQRSRDGEISRLCGSVSANTGQKSQPLALQGRLGVSTM